MSRSVSRDEDTQRASSTGKSKVTEVRTDGWPGRGTPGAEGGGNTSWVEEPGIVIQDLYLQVKELVQLICFGQSGWGLELPLVLNAATPC